uniref:Uncharacterized protein n=1 Tax=Anopheles atroparvus TaxID=41427 RepID=A0AAG5CU31_ANOAO
MIPCALDDPEQTRGRASPRPLMATVMYERLRRMSVERGLNLSPEDILISAYLGHNLIYKPQATGGEAGRGEKCLEGVGKTSPMAPGNL